MLATRNLGKVRELAEMLGAGWQVSSLRDLEKAPEVVEDGETFEANARKKALEISGVFEGMVLADDSGLEVDALKGAPGVYSARYAGEDADDEANTQKLLEALQGVEARGAQFRCVLIVARAGEVLYQAEGVCRGSIARSKMGDGGFGYDPVFIPEGYEESFGVLSSEVKNRMSHRGNAMALVLRWLESVR